MSHNPPNTAAPQPANPPIPAIPAPAGNDTGKPFLISLAIAVLVLFGVLHFHFVVLFVSILMTYCLIEGANAMLGKALGGRLQHKHVHLISVLSVVLAVCAMLGIAVYAGYTKINIDEFEAMYHRLPQILVSYGVDKYLPEGINIGEEISAFFAAPTAQTLCRRAKKALPRLCTSSSASLWALCLKPMWCTANRRNTRAFCRYRWWSGW